MHLVHLVLSLDPGGTERLVIMICEALRQQVSTEVVCLDGEGAWAGELTALGIPVTALHRRPGFRPGLAGAVRGRLRHPGPVALHCHHYTPFVYGAMAAITRPGTRLVYTEHGRLSDTPPSGKRRLANAFFGRVPGRIFAVSHDLGRHMVGEGLPARKVEVLHNGIVAGPAPDPGARGHARAALGLAPADFAIVTVARLTAVKDLGTALRAFAPVAARHPRARLLVIGDGPERAMLEALARDLGLGASLAMLGHRDDVRALLPAMDVYLNCSVIEGISVTILEAMAAGLPVIATAVGGNPEIVRSGHTGTLVPARSAPALGDAMTAYLGAPGTAIAHGAAGRRRMLEHFSFERMLSGYAAAYGLEA